MVSAFLVLLAVIASFAIWACTKIWRAIRSGESLLDIY